MIFTLKGFGVTVMVKMTTFLPILVVMGMLEGGVGLSSDMMRMDWRFLCFLYAEMIL